MSVVAIYRGGTAALRGGTTASKVSAGLVQEQLEDIIITVAWTSSVSYHQWSFS